MNEISREEINFYKQKYGVSYCTASAAPTACGLFGIEPPDSCGEIALPPVVDQAYHLFGGDGKCQKMLFYCPDAVGDIHMQKRPEIVGRLKDCTDMMFKCTTMMPSVTPVCFATIFSGSSPKVHGIQEYRKPVLTIQTLFDVLSAAGKNVAIAAINDCSIDVIFRKRNVDYYSFRSDELTHEFSLKLIEEDKYDVIISYYTSYDHFSHVNGPWSNEAIECLKTSVNYAEELIAATDAYWGKYNRVVAITPDHGNHEIAPARGVHGEDIPDDMLVNHFYRLRSR